MSKVLVVEDSLTDAAIVKDLLEKEGIEVSLAANVSDGYRKAMGIKPDLILLDLMLPDGSGFDLCARVKQEVSLSKTIVVIFSIKDNMEDITRAFQLGADDYIIKPPLPEFLVRKIRLYLGMR
ncbi:MAG TPA: response regulator [Candidatus Omnitrophota bacterium]|nr:response regulator [Candidatus Omnitrophota bacterium]